MPIVPIATLKNYFLNKYVPAYAQFVDLIDTLADSGGVSSSHDHVGGDGAPIPLAGMENRSSGIVIGRQKGSGAGVPVEITQGSGGGLDADLLDNMHVTTTGAWSGGSVVPRINGADGVMEVGKYIDFHAENTAAKDADSRLYVALLGSDGTQVLKVSNYGGVDGIIMNTGEFLGNTFPSGGRLWSGYPYFRSDLGLWCYWNGTYWLTMNEYSVTTPRLTGISSNQLGAYAYHIRDDYQPYFTRVTGRFNTSTTLTINDYWTPTWRAINGSYSSADNLWAPGLLYVNGWRADTASSAGNNVNRLSTFNPVGWVDVYFTKTGSPGPLDATMTFYYRLKIA